MPWEVVTPAAVEPVNRDEAKLALRIDTDADNVRLDGLLKAARAWAENHLRRKLITQTLRLWLDYFPCCPCDAEDDGDAWAITLPFAPVSAVSSISYYDATNTLQTLDPAAYQTDLVSVPARILPAFGYVWPITYTKVKAVKVDFVVGYANAAAVPQEYKNAILLRLQDLYDQTDYAAKAADALTGIDAPVAV